MVFAMGFSEYGGPEVLRPLDVEVPAPAAGEVRVRVRCAGVNPLDWKLRGGRMAAARTLAFPYVLGLEAAGVVESVGEDAGPWRVGDEVLGPVTAGYAVQTLARADRLVAKPPGLPWELAGGLPMAAETAYRTLTALRVAKDDTLLVHGAAGGVGSLAVQFAVSAGVRVIGTASPANHDYLRSLGAEPVAYGEGVGARVRELAPDVDAVLDAAGRGVLPESVDLAGGPARVLTIADAAGAQTLGVRFSRQSDGEDQYVPGIERALALYRDGRLHLPVWRALPLAEAPDAHRASEEGHLRGKIVLVAD
ncbi:NADPH:quinone reductase [Streptomyces sp. WAC 06738]|nr:NADP-dependent oxidoreductase [Streptomyces sp. WAC 06738]AZM45868.1 NADPH:quinone reductase [Streptomyces sp. WAC 06738]